MLLTWQLWICFLGLLLEQPLKSKSWTASSKAVGQGKNNKYKESVREKPPKWKKVFPKRYMQNSP